MEIHITCKLSVHRILLLICPLFVLAQELSNRKDQNDIGPCPVPEPIAHGEVSVWGDNLLIEYSCDQGFELLGNMFGACDIDTGEWTVEAPICVSDGCDEPPPPENGFVSVKRQGKMAVFLCDRGHYLVGKEKIYCYGGNWSDPIPECKGASDHALFGKKIMVKNDTKPVPANKTPAVDFEAEIRKTDTTCFRYRRKSVPPKIDYADVETKYIYNKYRRLWVIIANYTCYEGFEIPTNGSSYLFCQKYEWVSPVRPSCVKIPVHPCEEKNAGCTQLCIPGEKNFYHCDCYRGFSVGRDGHTCVDRNECLINNGGCEQLCRNTHGSRYCLCREGFAAVGNLCFDLDECQDDRVTKKCPADCVNTVGSYHCNCTIPGYRSIPDSPYCEDIDECAHRKGGCQGSCVNTPGSYRCKCRKGYKLAPDKRKCRDINECQLYGNRSCKHGKCFNRYGSYMCACDKGYIQHRNRIHCVDLDECKVIPNGGCEHRCVNTLGSYRCECTKPGYVLEDGGKTCLDVDECDHDNGGCQEVCVNYWGSHECRCNFTGHVLHPNGRNCTECPIHQYVDEKKKICIDCPPHSMVNNTLVIADSPQYCQCLPGFHGNPGLNMPCKDIDECLDENFGCQDVCNNTVGSVFCSCNHGYRLLDDQKNCEDIDECTEQIAGCNYTCYNTEGGFYCTCPQGYQLDYDNRSCIDVDECWLKSHNCTHLCVNTEGGWDCDCPKGFVLQDDDTTCLDFNECVQAGAVYCEDKCVNTQGSYRCECPHPGYKLSWDGASCSDLNECMEGENNCEDACINILGSFRCACSSEGYMLKDDGISCEDIDECQSPDLNRCEQGCENTAGGYECKCGAGYINAGYFHCKDCPENTYRDLSSTYCMLCPANSFTNGTGKGSRSDCVCQEGYHGDLGVEDECSDSDECEDDNFECEHMCYNTIGSAHCGCHEGYFLHDNNKNCTDIDECSYTRHYCADQCINMPGTYRCGCRSGFRIHYDGRYCTDVDECQEEAPCEDYCQNTWGSFHCQCLQWGYTLADDGISCVSSETGVKCPKEIFVEVAPLVNSTKVTLPSAIWSHDWNIIDPDWVKSEAAFPVGVTKVTLLSKGDGDSCTFNVNVIASCGYGTYKPESTDGSTLPCVKCDPGTYQNEIDRPFCKKCFIGTYQNQSGQSECRYCTPGSMQNQTGQSQCLQCPRGSFQDLNGQSECKQCFTGSFQNQTGQSECKFCHPGFYQNKTGQFECSPCLPGSFQSSSGQSSCIVCLPGTFQNLAGQAGCIFCPFGTYQNLTGQVKCKPCPDGTYQDDIGQTQCKECNEAAIVMSEFIKRQCINKS